MTIKQLATPKGLEALANEQLAISLWSRYFPNYAYVETPKETYAVVDAILCGENRVKAVVETKARQFTLVDLRNKYDNKWLVTEDKLIKSAAIADAMCVPLVGFLYLVPDDALVYRELWKPEKGWVCKREVQNTKTPKHINGGGDVIRANAFIDMSDAKVLRRKVNGP